ncbi:hypothetical protein LTR85_000102 [Meristemomyces frigidus]|nr:hypothetical protein LTR85_000102 [Meristemomyces frigidus]
MEANMQTPDQPATANDDGAKAARRKPRRSTRGGQQYKKRLEKQVGKRAAAEGARQVAEESEGPVDAGGESYGRNEIVERSWELRVGDWKCGGEACGTQNRLQDNFCPACGSSREQASATVVVGPKSFAGAPAASASVVTGRGGYVGEGTEIQLAFRPAERRSDHQGGEGMAE